MAEAKTASSAPAADAVAEAPVERTPAELEAGAEKSAPEPTKDNNEQKANGGEEKPAGKSWSDPCYWSPACPLHMAIAWT
jgi:hypothetical protein